MIRRIRPAPRALRALVTLALAMALSACGYQGSGARPPGAAGEECARAANGPALAAKATADLAEGLDLPEVQTIGDLPPKDSRVVIRIDREGALWVDGVPTSENAVVGRAPKHGVGRQRLDVLLAVDRTVPWAATVRILGMAANPLRTDRVQFLVAPEGGGEPGALATFLPTSYDYCAPEADADPVRVGVALTDGPGTNPAALHAALLALAAPSRDLRVHLAIQALVPTGEALRAVDVVFRAGYAFVGFDALLADADAQGTIREIVARARGAERAVRLTLNDLAVPAPPADAAPMSAVARVVGRPAGDWSPMEPPFPQASAGDSDARIQEAEVEEVEQRAGEPPAPASPTIPANVREVPRRPRHPPEDPVEFALRWLAFHQSPDGRFEAQGFAGWCRGEPWAGPRTSGAGIPSRDVETTSLALVVFHGAGWSRRSEGPNGSAVTRALSWLVGRQDEEGCLSDRSDPLFLRDHALATLALAMADRAALCASTTRLPLVRALAFATSARSPRGGWGRSVRSGDIDVVTTAWMAAAWTEARAASTAAVEAKRDPIALDEVALAEACEAVLAVTDPRTGVILGAPADPRVDALSPAAWTVRRLAGEDPKVGALAKASAHLLDALPTREAGRAFDPLAVWFGTLVAYERGGDLWKAWERALHDAVVATQAKEGDPCEAAGSWDPVGPSALEGGRVAATALLALVCEVYYRYDRFPGLAPAR